jgi:hypothetical protein
MGYDTEVTLVFEGRHWWRPLVRLFGIEERPLGSTRARPAFRLTLLDGRRVPLGLDCVYNDERGFEPGGFLVDLSGRVFAGAFYRFSMVANSGHAVLTISTVTSRHASALRRSVPLENRLLETLIKDRGLFGLHCCEYDYCDAGEPHDHLFWCRLERVRALFDAQWTRRELRRWCKVALEHHNRGWYLGGPHARPLDWLHCCGARDSGSLGSLKECWPASSGEGS